jgi:hypothetical protein
MRLESLQIFKGIPFLIMLTLGILNIWGNSTALNDRSGTSVYPTTSAMVDVIDGAFTVFAMLITAFYAGDIVWRERNLRLNEVTDSMPLPTWAQWAAKFTDWLFVAATTLITAIATSILIQAARGYSELRTVGLRQRRVPEDRNSSAAWSRHFRSSCKSC